MTYLMNVHTGSVDTKENWVADYADREFVDRDITLEEWMSCLEEVTEQDYLRSLLIWHDDFV